MTDTRITVLRADRGLVGGPALVFGRWARGKDLSGEPVTNCYVKGGRYYWFKDERGGPDVRLLNHHDIHDDAGRILSIIPTDAGLYVLSVLHDAELMVKAEHNLLYYTPAILFPTPTKAAGVYNGGLLAHVGVTDCPGLPPTAKHAWQNEQTQMLVDETVAALETYAESGNADVLAPWLKSALLERTNE